MSLPAATGRIFDMGSYRIGDPGGRIGFTLARGKPYEWRLLYQMRALGLSGSAFDVGAHVGNHSLWMAAECGLTVYAWEPHPDSRRHLMDNLALNPDLAVTIYDWAAGDAEGFGRFNATQWMSFDPTRGGTELETGTGSIPVHRIDDHLDVPDLSVVKVDVEGMEPQVLDGLTRHLARSAPIVYVETHTDRAMRRIRDVIGPLGYRKTQTISMGSRMDRWQCR